MNDQDAKPKADDAESLSTAGVGTAVIVRGRVVAWFADWTEEASEWCTENHFGEWLTWRAKPPEIVPLTPEEYDQAMKAGAKLAAKLNIEPEAGSTHAEETLATMKGE